MTAVHAGVAAAVLVSRQVHMLRATAKSSLAQAGAGSHARCLVGKGVHPHGHGFANSDEGRAVVVAVEAQRRTGGVAGVEPAVAGGGVSIASAVRRPARATGAASGPRSPCTAVGCAARGAARSGA